MSSDRARLTFNPPQRYRSVVMQQGRVQLEADWNEGQDIWGRELNADVLDIVGPVGTPDDGYKVSIDPNTNKQKGDFTIGKGTMYVGGIRHELFTDLTYLGQKDFDWVNGPAPSPGQGVRHISLWLREQEVSAVEDADLKDVALGGPDTAQRKRILQRVLSNAVEVADCDKAWVEIVAGFAKKGYTFESKTMRLHSNNRLQVGFVASLVPPDPCEPVAHGGYLGADNQCIQVKVVEYDAAKKVAKIVWGFDNASFLFRAVVQPDQKTLVLNQQPVDTFHWPRANQAVELLQSAAKLSNGQFVAENLGFVSTLAADYNVDDQSVILTKAAPAADYPANQTTPPIYLRMWEEVLEVEVGKPVTLGHTGLQVTITPALATMTLSLGEFWSFAVRPTTPQSVYPERYTKAPQPPEGPRQWLAPLAVIQWADARTPEITDCREVFDDLVTLTKRKAAGCCTVVVRPEDAPRLQEILDRFKSTDKGKSQVNICLMPGTYVLPAPLKLGAAHSGFTIEACHGGVIFQADPKNLALFGQGMAILMNADQVTFCGITFELAQAPFKDLKDTTKDFDLTWMMALYKLVADKLRISIGIRALMANDLTICGCDFKYTAQSADDLFAVGISLSGDCRGLRIVDSDFGQTDTKLAVNPSVRPLKLLFGILLLPIVNRNTVPGTNTTTGIVLPSLLDGSEITGNRFVGLTTAGLVFAVLGAIRLTNNTVTECYQGFTISSLYVLLMRQAIGAATVPENAGTIGQGLTAKFMRSSDEPVTMAALSFMRSYPMPAEFDTSKAIKVETALLDKEPDLDIRLIQPMVDSAVTAFTSVAATRPGAPGTPIVLTPGATVIPPVAAGTRVAIRTLIQPQAAARARDVMNTFKAAEVQIGTVERQALAKFPGSDLVPSIYVAGNHFSTMIVETKSSSHSLTMLSGPVPAGSSVVMEGNYFQNGSTDTTVEVTAFERITMTGNQFLNENHVGDNVAHTRSVEVIPSGNLWLFTATGNAFLAFTNIADLKRSDTGYGGDLSTWMFANTMRL